MDDINAVFDQKISELRQREHELKQQSRNVSDQIKEVRAKLHPLVAVRKELVESEER